MNPTAPPIPEKQILRQCLAELKFLGLHPERQNAGLITLTSRSGKKRVIQLSPGGALDIKVTLPGGRLCEIEVKRLGGKPSAAQLARIRYLNGQGAVAFWVDDPATIARLMPKILEGAWVEEVDGAFFVEDGKGE